MILIVNHHLVVRIIDLNFTLVHEQFKCLKTGQKDLPIIQLLHTFVPGAARSRDIGGMHRQWWSSEGKKILRLALVKSGDRDLDSVETRCDVPYSDSSHDFGIKGRLNNCWRVISFPAKTVMASAMDRGSESE